MIIMIIIVTIVIIMIIPHGDKDTGGAHELPEPPGLLRQAPERAPELLQAGAETNDTTFYIVVNNSVSTISSNSNKTY